jgi:hypothetical protein
MPNMFPSVSLEYASHPAPGIALLETTFAPPGAAALSPAFAAYVYNHRRGEKVPPFIISGILQSAQV